MKEQVQAQHCYCSLGPQAAPEASLWPTHPRCQNKQVTRTFFQIKIQNNPKSHHLGVWGEPDRFSQEYCSNPIPLLGWAVSLREERTDHIGKGKFLEGVEQVSKMIPPCCKKFFHVLSKHSLRTYYGQALSKASETAVTKTNPNHEDCLCLRSLLSWPFPLL